MMTVFISCRTLHSGMQKPAPLPAFDKEGHRGARGLMPENTIPGMLKAIDMDLTTLEMDLQITADRQVILSHDNHINPAFTLTGEGKEISEEDAKKRTFYKMNFDQVKSFDVGTKFYDKYPKQQKLKVHIPLLSEVIDSVQTYLAVTGKPQVFYNIETKSSAAGDNLYHPEPNVFIKLVMDVVEGKKITPWTIIQSFDVRTLQVLHDKYPHVRSSFLVEQGSLKDNLQTLGFTPSIYSPAAKLVTAGLVKEVQAKGMKIIPWTVNEKQEIDRLEALGVDGIITDYPDLFNQ
ncbi:MAG TPA: glycerophosphodiester phosphodiesterase family protein [Daejeonella sp.]|nr:glycerophosphodiester phosphodiesterase family protein [Daejeonella sp.]